MLDKVLSFLKFPTTEEGLHVVARGLNTSRKDTSHLDGCVDALDVYESRLRSQTGEVIQLFYCRKGYYSIPFQAVCDSDYIFRYASGLCGGATHDSLANEVPGFMEGARGGLLRLVLWIAADEAYRVSDCTMVPFPSSTLTKDEDNFNFYLSSLRIHNEQAFGMLVARWRILGNGLNFYDKRCTERSFWVLRFKNFNSVPKKRLPNYDFLLQKILIAPNN